MSSYKIFPTNSNPKGSSFGTLILNSVSSTIPPLSPLWSLSFGKSTLNVHERYPVLYTHPWCSRIPSTTSWLSETTFPIFVLLGKSPLLLVSLLPRTLIYRTYYQLLYFLQDGSFFLYPLVFKVRGKFLCQLEITSL